VSGIGEAWAHIEAWLKSHAPHEEMGPPATPEALAKLATALGGTLPPSLGESLRLHDGARFGISLKSGHGPWTLLRASAIERDWKCLQSLHAELDEQYGDARRALRADGPVSAVWWRAEWIPFASNGAGDLLCVDMAPEPGGRVEQVVLYLRDPSPRKVMAPSLAAFLEEFVDGLESGAYVVDPFLGIVLRDEEK
jgi:cell wall assembly regulator SMI1